MNIRQFYVLIFSFLLVNIFSTSLAFADTTYNNAFQLQSEAINNGGYIRLTKSGSPYFFPNSLQIEANITVDIDPGVVINMLDRSMSIQNGTLNYNGTKEDPITINSASFTNNIWINAVYPGQAPTVNYNNVVFNGFGNCNIIYNKATVNITDSQFNNCMYYAVYVGYDSNTTIKNIQDNYTFGNSQHGTIFASVFDANTMPGTLRLSVEDTNFYKSKNNKIHIADYTLGDPQSTIIKLNNNNFYGFVPSSILENSPFVVWDEYNSFKPNSFVPVDAMNNYWGTDAGPYHAGGTPTNGPQLPTNIVYEPYLTRDPNSVKECCSSVLFIPGIEGSRLYKQDISNIDGEDQLWEPNTPSDVTALNGDVMGNTDSSIYTRDIIEKTNSLGDIIAVKNIYKNIVTNLQVLKDTKNIKDYKTLPYDWRENVNDIVVNGIKHKNETLMLLPLLEQMAKDSDTGKLTIVTHSNGGLLVKMLIKELENQGKANLVDKVVMVAAPQNGTPDAIYALLHGLDFGMPSGIIAPQKNNRELAKNIEMTYALLPSKKFYNNAQAPVYFGDSIGNYQNFVSSYGSDINSYDELKNFILAKQDGRPQAAFDETSQISIGNEYLYNKAEAVHAAIDDYVFPNNIKLYQVSGTGVYTNKSIIYRNRKVLFNNVFTPYLAKNIYGDGTVLNSSSTVMPGENYYFDLLKYNKDNNTDLNHANILEANSMTDFINKVIKNEDIINQYITNISPQYNDIPTTIITMHSPVDIHLYDWQGRHTGPVYEELNGVVVSAIEESIPNSHYEIIGDSTSIIITGNEEYKLKLDGYDNGVFTLDINKYLENTEVSNVNFVDLPATVDLVSEVTISPNTVNDQIILDVNNDGDPDYISKNSGELVNLHEHDCSHKDKDLKNKKEKDKVCKNKKEKHEKKNKDEKPRKWHSKKY